jgi:hypothetical protein
MDEWKTVSVEPYLCTMVRSRMKPWMQKILRESNNKCIVTGEEAECVHHIVPFVGLLKRAIFDLGYQGKTYEELTQDEFDLLVSKCLENHYLHGEGAPLKQEIHQIFHSEYGIQKHTKEDFENFISYIKEDVERFYSEHKEKLNPSTGFSREGIDEGLADIESSIQMIKIEFSKKTGVHVELVKDMFDTIKTYCDNAIKELPIKDDDESAKGGK